MLKVGEGCMPEASKAPASSVLLEIVMVQGPEPEQSDVPSDAVVHRKELSPEGVGVSVIAEPAGYAEAQLEPPACVQALMVPSRELTDPPPEPVRVIVRVGMTTCKKIAEVLAAKLVSPE